MCLDQGALLPGLEVVSTSLGKMGLFNLTSVCQISVWYDNVVTIIIVNLAVLGV
jgi:hypothetical protein